MKRHFSSILLIFVISIISSYSQSRVEIKDTAIDRGNLSHFIPIYGTIEQNPISSINLEIEYNAKLILVKAIIGSNNYAMKCTFIEPTPPEDPYEQAKLSIICNDAQPINNGIICMLEIEALAGNDSISYIKPQKILLNGTEPQDISYQQGKVIVSQIPIIQKNPEGLGKNFPNPFTQSTIFPFNIENKTPLTFKIFSLRGKEVINNEDLNTMFTIEKIAKNGNIKIDDLKNPVEQGSYIFIFNPIVWKFASGGYYLVMKTNKGVYNSSFLYIK